LSGGYVVVKEQTLVIQFLREGSRTQQSSSVPSFPFQVHP
jgi:hypothetical protein